MTSPLAAEVHALLAALPRAVPDDARPLLDARVADVLRALDDDALLRLCAPGLRDLLAQAEADDVAPPVPLPAPVAAPSPPDDGEPAPEEPGPVSGTQARPLPRGYGSREVYDRHRARVRKRQDENRAAWLAAGLCTGCGGEVDVERSPYANRAAAGVRCSGCREVHKAKDADRAERREQAA